MQVSAFQTHNDLDVVDHRREESFKEAIDPPVRGMGKRACMVHHDKYNEYSISSAACAK